jgi:protein O-GlcNAc transferase
MASIAVNDEQIVAAIHQIKVWLQHNRQPEALNLMHTLLQYELTPELKRAVWIQQGLLLLAKDQYALAEAAFRQALWLKPEAEVFTLLGMTLLSRQREEQARTCFEQALQLQPNYLPAVESLATLFQCQGDRPHALKLWLSVSTQVSDPQEIEPYVHRFLLDWLNFEDALQLPATLADLPQDLKALPAVLFIQGWLSYLYGEPTQALSLYEQMLQLRPQDSLCRSRMLFLSILKPECDEYERFVPFYRWGCQQERVRPMCPQARASSTGRRLRVGYLSGDLNLHSSSSILLGLLQAHQHQDFYWVIYANTEGDDEFTQRFRRAVELWRPCVHWSDQQLAEQIRADEIDILVDCSGHTAGHRLGVFALKPAPLQIGGLGFGWTTGLSRMDYQLSDRWIAPPERAALYTEQVLYLPTLFHWQPAFTLVTLPVVARPAERGQTIVLGSGNESFKLNAHVTAVWCEILKQLPEARLELKSRYFNNPLVARHFRQRFERQGLEPERLTLLGKTSHAEHVRWYGQLDITLDVFPYNGGVSTLESLWMGVPVMGLTGGTRAAVSLLNTLDLSELLADNETDYVARTVALAHKPERLNHYRQTLRQRLLSSPICDSRAYARAVETAYREAWRQIHV